MTITTTQTDHREHVAFYLNGTRAESALNAIEELDLRPALFAPYRDLASLRYDFPVILTRQQADTPYVSLTSVIDRLLAAVAPGDGDRARVRKHLHRHEAEIRRLVAGGATGTLGKLWALAAQRAASDASLNETLTKARAALDCDGQVADCDASLPPRLFIRSWRFAQDRKIRAAQARIERYILKLEDILRADFAASAAARTPARLRASVGTAFEDAFDFEQMSAILNTRPQTGGLSPARRARIESLLSILESQRFFARDGSPAPGREPYGFVYTGCAEAREAYRERMPLMIELAKAMAIAELEIAGEYDEERHDALFEAFGANGLAAEEIAQFPDYLLWMYAASAEEYGELLALLAAGVPLKALIQFDDLLESSPVGDGRLTLSLRSKHLTDGAVGLNTVYVLQSSASNLVRMKESVLRGLAYAGPALFSIYSGAGTRSGLAPYLVSAAAMECRAFPSFTYDPSAGAQWAERFSIAGNPQPERDWPLQSLSYEDADHQRITEALPFTPVDYLACDLRYARHFARVPRARCNGDMVTVHEWLARDEIRTTEHVPALAMVDSSDVLQKVLVDDNAIREAQRCRDIWHSLQELGGIHNSHAERLLAHEREAWERQRKADAKGRVQPESAAANVAARAAAVPAPVVEAASVEAVADEVRSDEAYIETPRCTTCEECMQINNRMFVYDANKQAYIADINAGTYRQLVEAAEACQVSIIHPGKPRDPAEPGLEELVQRAEPFQ